MAAQEIYTLPAMENCPAFASGIEFKVQRHEDEYHSIAKVECDVRQDQLAGFRGALKDLGISPDNDPGNGHFEFGQAAQYELKRLGVLPKSHHVSYALAANLSGPPEMQPDWVHVYQQPSGKWVVQDPSYGGHLDYTLAEILPHEEERSRRFWPGGKADHFKQFKAPAFLLDDGHVEFFLEKGFWVEAYGNEHENYKLNADGDDFPGALADYEAIIRTDKDVTGDDCCIQCANEVDQRKLIDILLQAGVEFRLGGRGWFVQDKKEKLQVIVGSPNHENMIYEFQKLQALGVKMRMDREIVQPGYEEIVRQYIELPWEPALPSNVATTALPFPRPPSL